MTLTVYVQELVNLTLPLIHVDNKRRLTSQDFAYPGSRSFNVFDVLTTAKRQREVKQRGLYRGSKEEL